MAAVIMREAAHVLGRRFGCGIAQIFKRTV